MASILPNEILPESTPLLDQDGKTIAHNWWLFLYNLSQSVLGNKNTTASPFAVQTQLDVESDVDSTDNVPLFRRIENLEKRISDEYPQVIDSSALLWAQDVLLLDPVPRAAAVQTITVGASPFTYTANADGLIVLNGGTLSALTLSRDGVTFYAVPQGIIPMSRLDRVTMTYTVAPTAVFFPR